MKGKLAALITLMVLLIIFTAQNYGLTQIRFLFWSFKSSTAIIILFSLASGAVIGWALSFLKKK